MPKITKRIVDATEPNPTARVYVWDDQIKGFGVQVLPSGVRSYVFQYRSRDGRTHRATLGKHGNITCEEARTKADAFRRAVVEGRDPLQEKSQARHAVTVGDVLDAYLESEAFKSKAVATRATDKGRIVRHLVPLLGRVPVETLRPEDVAKAHNAICSGRTAVRERTGPRGLARVRGGEGAARKSVRLLRTALAWALREGRIKSNPLASYKTGTDGTRDVILESADDYARLYDALDRMQAECRIRAAVADAIRFISLTGCRRGEAAGLRWSYVNLKAGLVTLPPSGHKTGRKTGKPRIIGLPTAVQLILSRQPAGGPDDFVFKPAHGKGPINLSKPWVSVRAEAKLPAGVGLHSLRHSIASHHAMAGGSASEIQTLLGHSTLAQSSRYIHWAQLQRQVIAEKAAAVALAGMAAGTGNEVKGVVLPLKGSAQ